MKYYWYAGNGEQRERVLASQQRETLSELSVEEVFNRRLALEELEESRQQQRLQHLFTTTLHTLAGEHEHEKILSLRLKLNSLRRMEDRFHPRAVRQQRAVCHYRPNRCGKTTLLYADCLALYHELHASNVSQSQNDLITR